MAKRRAGANTETATETVEVESPKTSLRAGERGEKAELVRKLLTEHADKSTSELNQLFLEEARRRGADLGDASGMISVYRSQMHGETAKRPRMRRASTPTASDPSLTQLRLVKQLLDEAGGVGRLQDEIDRVLSIAEQVGGMENLRSCLNFWRETLSNQE